MGRLNEDDWQAKWIGYDLPGQQARRRIYLRLPYVGEWIFSTLAAIDTDGPGFPRILIRPQPGGDLTFARASYDSIRGRRKPCAAGPQLKKNWQPPMDADQRQ